jgi:hypothetical protein
VDAAPGKDLRIETLAAAVIHWTADDWKTCHQQKTHDTGLDIPYTNLPPKTFRAVAQISLAFFWKKAQQAPERLNKKTDHRKVS